MPVDEDERGPLHASTQAFDPTLTDTPQAAAPRDAAAGPAVAPGRTGAERYTIEGEHARGGLGRILRARDGQFPRTVALKEMLTRDRESEERFLREASITARLEHPSIVPVHELGRRPDGRLYYTMKLLAGQPLSAVLGRPAPLEARLALVARLLAVADALAYAHDRRVIHRDLKPSNIVLGEYGETMVIDWGLAKDLAAHDDDAPPSLDRSVPMSPDLTAAGAVMGTPAYMAPEQARGEPTTERSDVYALGAILFHVLAGRAPREATSVAALLEQARRGQLRALRDAAPEAPLELAAIVDKAVAAAPEARYASARELAEDLRRFLAGQLVSARGFEAPPPRELLRIDLATVATPARLTSALTVRLVVALLTTALNLSSAANAPPFIDRTQAWRFCFATLPYAGAALVAGLVRLLGGPKRPRLAYAASLGLAPFEAAQVTISLLFSGLGHAVTLGYLLMMVMLFTTFIDGRHGLLGAALAVAALGAAQALGGADGTPLGWSYVDRHLGSLPAQAMTFNFVTQVLLVVIIYVTGAILGARLRWQQRRLEEQNRRIVDQTLGRGHAR